MSTKPKEVEHFLEVKLHKGQLKAIEAVRKQKLGGEYTNLLNELLEYGALPEEADFAKLNAFLTRVRQLSNVVYEGECQPKVSRVAKMAKDGPKPVMIYSEFKKNGIDNVAHCLKQIGVPSSEIAHYHGSLSKMARNKIVNDYNNGKVKYLLVTSAGAEGLSLKATRQIHILEPYWNMARAMQVKGRGIRIDSHGHLPKSERKVDVYYWLSVAENNDDASLAPDIYLMDIARSKMEVIEKFEGLNEEASIPITIPDFQKYRGLKKRRRSTKKKEKKTTKKSRRRTSKRSAWMRSKSRSRVMRRRSSSRKSIRKRSNTANVSKAKTSISRRKRRSTKKKRSQTKEQQSKSKSNNSNCKESRPPCPKSCSTVKAYSYKIKKSGKTVNRRSSCRKKK